MYTYTHHLHLPSQTVCIHRRPDKERSDEEEAELRASAELG